MYNCKPCYTSIHRQIEIPYCPLDHAQMSQNMNYYVSMSYHGKNAYSDNIVIV